MRFWTAVTAPLVRARVSIYVSMSKHCSVCLSLTLSAPPSLPLAFSATEWYAYMSRDFTATKFKVQFTNGLVVNKVQGGERDAFRVLEVRFGASCARGLQLIHPHPLLLFKHPFSWLKYHTVPRVVQSPLTHSEPSTLPHTPTSTHPARLPQQHIPYLLTALSYRTGRRGTTVGAKQAQVRV